MEWWRKLAGLRHRARLEAELREEMQTHLEFKSSATGDLQTARRQFGNLTLLMEESRAAWGWPQFEAWLRDFRFAVRMLARKPAFATTVILTLALGIGASCTIFSLIDRVLIRPLPYPEAERLVALREVRLSEGSTGVFVSPGRLEDWHRLNSSFEAIAASYTDTLTDATGTVPERVSASFVSPRFFAVFRTSAALGRVFTPEEEQFGGAPAIVISDGYWRRRFGADPRVIGRQMVLTAQNYTIVGVMPRSFQYPNAANEVWVSKQATPALMRIRQARFYAAVGRLKPGVTSAQAQSDLTAVQNRLGTLYPKTDAGWAATVQPLKDLLIGRVRLALVLLLGTVSVLLLIACANVACLMLTRLNGRAIEIATRRSLGAGRAAIARQLFAEGLVSALAGGTLGAVAVFAGIGILRKQLTDIPRVSELAVDARILAVVCGVSIVTAILFSLAPIFQSFRRDVTGSLISAGVRVAGGRQRLPRVLVSAQIALATALLIAAGLFVRSLLQTENVALGFRPENVLALRIGASFSEAPDAAVQRHQRTLDAISSVPEVSRVAMSFGLPGVNPAFSREFQIAGEPSTDGTDRFASWRVVTAAYFETVGIPIQQGRTCQMNTDPARAFEILVNRSFADHYFPGRDPIGRAILQRTQGAVPSTIVGVVGDAREDGHTSEPQPLIYSCGYLRFWPDSDFLIQTSRPAAAAMAVQAAIGRLEPSRPVYAVRPLTDALHGALAQTRFRTLLISLFSIMALTLAAIGLYGVMAYMVSQRTREIGIRIALGARRGQILADILRSGGILTIVGAVAGIALAAAISRMMRTLLYGVQPTDVISYLAAVVVLGGVALLACLVPGRRATSIDPTQALRDS